MSFEGRTLLVDEASIGNGEFGPRPSLTGARPTFLAFEGASYHAGLMMKGIVFTEFLELVEQKWGLAMADRLLVKGCPFHGGYTAVGTYDHVDLISMVVELAQATDLPVPVLVKAFGKYLFEKFLHGYPEAFEGVTGTFQLLERVEKTIHVEVRKLTPDAELPHFDFHAADNDELDFTYRSTRPFADLAEGLILGCIEHFREELSIHREDLSPDGTTARFRLIPQHRAPCVFPESPATNAATASSS